jgi:hypothetical protein
MDEKLFIEHLLVIASALRARLVYAWRERHKEAGMTTLEVAVITLGLLVIATAIVAAVKAAVDQRIAKIH